MRSSCWAPLDQCRRLSLRRVFLSPLLGVGTVIPDPGRAPDLLHFCKGAITQIRRHVLLQGAPDLDPPLPHTALALNWGWHRGLAALSSLSSKSAPNFDDDIERR